MGGAGLLPSGPAAPRGGPGGRRAITAGPFPDDPEAIRALPGVGRYIAGAILSFAFDRPAPIVEANTQRVLARWLAWREDLKSPRRRRGSGRPPERLVPPRGRARSTRHSWSWAPWSARRGRRCAWSARSPRECRARALGLQDDLPVTVAQGRRRWRSPRRVPLVVRGGRLLIVQRGPGGLWEGFWEFPTIHRSGADPAGRSLRRAGRPGRGRPPPDRRPRHGSGRSSRPSASASPSTGSSSTAHEAIGLSDDLSPGPGLAQATWESPEKLANYPFRVGGPAPVGLGGQTPGRGRGSRARGLKRASERQRRTKPRTGSGRTEESLRRPCSGPNRALEWVS